MRNRIVNEWLIWLCVGTATLAGCEGFFYVGDGGLPEFKNPLPTEDLTVDEAILGVWHLQDTDEEIQLIVYPRKSGWVDLVWIFNINSDSCEDGVTVVVFEGFSAEINQQKFFCLRQRKKDFSEGLESKFVIYHYEVTEEGTILTRPLSRTAVKRMVKEGTLKGTTATGSSIDVTSSSHELADVIVKKGVTQLLDKDDDSGYLWGRQPSKGGKGSNSSSGESDDDWSPFFDD